MLVKPNGTIYLKEFDSSSSICKMSDNTAIDSSLYSLTEVADLAASVISSSNQKTIISFVSDPLFYEGEPVIYVDGDGIERYNKITAIGRDKKYLLNEMLQGKSALDSLIIKRVLVKVDFLNVPEGVYYVKPTNEMIIVRESWADPYISYSSLTTILPDLKNLKESEIKEMNNAARDLIYAEIVKLDLFSDIIFESDLVVLKQKAILYLYANRFQFDTDRDLKTEYFAALGRFTHTFKLKNKGQDENFAPETDFAPKKKITGDFEL